MAWRPQTSEDKLRQRIAFLETQLHPLQRLATEAYELLRENTELRKRQHWLETENNRLTTRLSAMEQDSQVGRKLEHA